MMPAGVTWRDEQPHFGDLGDHRRVARLRNAPLQRSQGRALERLARVRAEQGARIVEPPAAGSLDRARPPRQGNAPDRPSGRRIEDDARAHRPVAGGPDARLLPGVLPGRQADLAGRDGRRTRRRGRQRAGGWCAARRRPRVQAAALGLVAFGAGAHAALYGYSSWLTPSSWPGYLPPITLVSFAAGIIGVLVALRGPSSPPVSR